MPPFQTFKFQLANHNAVNQLFSNFTWVVGVAQNVDEERILATWQGPANNVFLTLVLFIVMRVRGLCIAHIIDFESFSYKWCLQGCYFAGFPRNFGGFGFFSWIFLIFSGSKKRGF